MEFSRHDLRPRSISSIGETSASAHSIFVRTWLRGFRFILMVRHFREGEPLINRLSPFLKSHAREHCLGMLCAVFRWHSWTWPCVVILLWRESICNSAQTSST